MKWLHLDKQLTTTQMVSRLDDMGNTFTKFINKSSHITDGIGRGWSNWCNMIDVGIERLVLQHRECLGILYVVECMLRIYEINARHKVK